VRGQSGNPVGKPRGARNKVTIAVEGLMGAVPRPGPTRASASGPQFPRKNLSCCSRHDVTAADIDAGGGVTCALLCPGPGRTATAVYLAGQAAKVWLIVRGVGLEASMSRYLVERIKGQQHESEVAALRQERDTEVAALRQEIAADRAEYSSRLGRLQEDNSALESLLADANDRLASHAGRIDDPEKQLAERDRMIIQRDSEAKPLHNEIAAAKRACFSPSCFPGLHEALAR
jgi:hypothetical protein